MESQQLLELRSRGPSGASANRRPVDNGTSEAAHALNRRVELQFIKS